MCCSVGVEPHPRTHTPTYTHAHRTKRLCGKAQGLIWGILSVSWSACQVHCVTGDSMTSSQPLQSYASASISLHIYTHTHRHGVVGGAPIPLWLIFTCLTQEHDWVPTLYTSPHTHTHTHTSVSPGCWNTAESLCFTFHPPVPLFWFLFFSCLSTSLSFFCHFTLIHCSMVVLSSAVCPCIALLLPRLSFWIFICVLFSSFLASHSFSSLFLFFSCYPPPLPYFQAFLSFHRFATLLPPSPTLTSHSFSTSISPLLPQHTKQNFSDYFSSWETLETQVRDPPPLPSAVTMTTATALSFIEEGWKEGGGAGSLLCVVTQR